MCKIEDTVSSENGSDSTENSLTIDDMLSGLIYITIKSQMADTPLLI